MRSSRGNTKVRKRRKRRRCSIRENISPAAHGGPTPEQLDIPEGLQLVDNPCQSRFFLTGAAAHGKFTLEQRESVRRKE